MFKWIKPANKENCEILLDTDRKLILGYVLLRAGVWVTRRLTVDTPYNCLDDSVNFVDYPMRTSVGLDKKNAIEAKTQLEQYFKIVAVEGNQEILKILMQLKNLEIYGKLDITIHVEGWQKPEEAKK